ncbi:MAG TPA: ABC transporter ATP-binding protein [Brevibacterium senegalense]|uniref:ABC transporter ATP-binding protein n=1 Tax=Brevibacterium senegalense TaxID=1033736 RepID=A0A921MDM4_9MICO|nr:ABC transporter ATP-binding protein [Brevibacterium senegalense]
MSTLPLRIERLALSYGGSTAVEDVSLTAEAGRVHALLGPNGAGKSSTIACAAGLRDPRSGSIRIFGLDPRTDHTRTAELAGVMLQDGGLPMSARPLAVLRHLARLYRDPADVDALAERLGITGFASRSIRRLSGGQRQRVALAAALVGRPRLVFLDEPTAGLDPQARLAVDAVVEELREEGTAIVLTTHDMADAERLADCVTVIDHGRVIAHGTVASLTGTADGAAPGRTATIVVEDGIAEEALIDLAEEGIVHVDGAVITVDCAPGVDALHRIAGVLAAHGTAVRSVGFRGKSLADVFLELTGRSLR